MSACDVRGGLGCARIVGPSTLIAILCLMLTRSAAALEWEFDDLSVRFDTTLSQGVTVRASEPDEATIGLANGGSAYSVNHDDGTLNYDNGKISQNVSRFTSDLDIDGGALSAFFRVTGFIDWEQRNGTRARTPLTEQALDIVGERLELLDAYVTGNFDIGQAPAQLRFGQQVLSWGEGTFIPGGINVINPIDVAQFRTPGAELREALKPVTMLSGSVSVTDSITLEAFYQLDWKAVEIDPPGTYFSINDFVGDGGSRVFLGFGDFSDLGTSFGPLTAAINADLGALPPQPLFDPTFLGVPRGADDDADDGGQFGLAMRFFSEQLQGTEFGLYYIRYNSRLPIISAHTGTAAGVNLALASASAVANPAGATAGAVGPAAAAQIGGAIGVDRYGQTASYFIEYPEDINLFGASFNTELGNSGWALQGEYSFKKDAPLQIDDVELLFAALTPVAALNPSFTDNQVGIFGPDTVIHGFIERDVSQMQATATKIFGPMLGANTGIFLVEVGANHVHGMPSQDTLRLNGSATDTSGNPRQAQAINPATGAPGAHAGKAAEPESAFPSPWSWGYRMAAQLTYDNVFAAINLSPRIQWAHDVQGISPQPAGPFREGRKAVSVGLKATYLQQWELDLAYTDFFGAGKYNLSNDRDFFTATLKFSF